MGGDQNAGTPRPVGYTALPAARQAATWVWARVGFSVPIVRKRIFCLLLIWSDDLHLDRSIGPGMADLAPEVSGLKHPLNRVCLLDSANIFLANIQLIRHRLARHWLWHDAGLGPRARFLRSCRLPGRRASRLDGRPIDAVCPAMLQRAKTDTDSAHNPI